MNKIITLSLAGSVLAKMLEAGKIDYSQYIEYLDEIKDKLEVSDAEYLNFINKNW